MDGAFILFNNQIAAHMAVQTLTHHEPYCMPYSLKYAEATPEDIIWKNLALNPYRRRLRLVFTRIVGIVLTIGWTIPGEPRLNLAQPMSRAETRIQCGWSRRPHVSHLASAFRLDLFSFAAS